MTRGTTICCSAIALTTLAAAAKPDVAPTSLLPIRPVWTLALNSHLTFPPTHDGTRVFFAIEEDRLTAYEIESGRQLWLVDAKPIVQPIVDGEHVYLAETSSLVALRVSDGGEAWRVSADAKFARRPAASGDWVIAAADDGSVRAHAASDGHLVWDRNIGSPAHAAPAISTDAVYVATTDGRIVALQLGDGEPIWERRVGGSPNEILVQGDRLFAGSTDNFFYCLMTRDGRIDWRWRTGADVNGMPVADANRVYFVSLDNVLRSLNKVSGGQQWMRALPLRPTSGPLLIGGTVVVSGVSPTIRTFTAKDGVPLPDIPAGDDVVASPFVLSAPGSGLPMLGVATRNITRGDVVGLVVHSMDPAVAPLAPLPNPIMPVPTPPTPR